MSQKRKRPNPENTQQRRPRSAVLVHPALKLGTEMNVQLSPESSYSVIRGGVVATLQEFEEMWAQMPPPTPNPMNRNTFIRRRQCTYGGHSYSFGAQTSPPTGSFAAAPTLVRRGLAWAQKDAARFPGIVPDDIVVAHCNFYDGGEAALAIHQDVEPQNKGRPIWSMTFIADSDTAAGYRYFCIYSDKSGKELVKALGLCSGDVLVMQGGVPARILARSAENRPKRLCIAAPDKHYVSGMGARQLNSRTAFVPASINSPVEGCAYFGR